MNRIIDSFPRKLKLKNIRIKNNTGSNTIPVLFQQILIGFKAILENGLSIDAYIRLWKIVSNTMLYIIFQYGGEPVLIQRILIGFEAILENGLSIDKAKVL